MSFSTGIRQFHRIISVVFVVTVVANFAAMSSGPAPTWIVYSPLPPLFLLILSGSYLFVLPHTKNWRTKPGS